MKLVSASAWFPPSVCSLCAHIVLFRKETTCARLNPRNTYTRTVSFNNCLILLADLIHPGSPRAPWSDSTT